MKPWYRSRIVLLNLAATLATALVQLLPEVRESFTPMVYGWLAMGVGLLNVALRFVTTQPLGSDK